jgi:hypothetical protein
LVATPFPAISLPVSRRKRIFYFEKNKRKEAYSLFVFPDEHGRMNDG